MPPGVSLLASTLKLFSAHSPDFYACPTQWRLQVQLVPTASNHECSQGERGIRPVVLPFVYNPGTNYTDYVDFVSPNQPSGFIPTPSIDMTYSQRISAATKQAMSKWRVIKSSKWLCVPHLVLRSLVIPELGPDSILSSLGTVLVFLMCRLAQSLIIGLC